MQEMKSALDRKVDMIRHMADDADRGYEVERGTFETEFYHSTTVEVNNGWERFVVSLGPRGGLRKAEYNASGWGNGDFVDQYDTKAEAWSTLKMAIQHPEPYE